MEAIIDSQSVKSAAMVSQSVGYDAGKQIKGRKRFITVDKWMTINNYTAAWFAGESSVAHCLAFQWGISALSPWIFLKGCVIISVCVLTLGLVLQVWVTAASLGERSGGRASTQKSQTNGLDISFDDHLGGRRL